MYRLLLASCLVLAVSAQCSNKYSAGEHRISLRFGGKNRQFLLYVPQNLQDGDRRPAVFNWHGYGSSGAAQSRSSEMNEVAGDGQKWFTVHPDGDGFIKAHNGGTCCDSAPYNDDVGFARAMVDFLDDNLCLERSAIFSTGFSNGGFMSHRLACEDSSLYLGIAPHSGVLGTSDRSGDFRECKPSAPVNVLHIHGTRDPTVPYNGNGSFKSVEETMSVWASEKGCRGEPKVVFETATTVCERFTDCQDGAYLELCTIEGLRHDWSKAGDAGQPSSHLNSTMYMVESFRKMI